jgi:cation/acetate symporter
MASVLQQVQQLEEKIFDDPGEVEARRLFRERADAYHDRILMLPESLERSGASWRQDQRAEERQRTDARCGGARAAAPGAARNSEDARNYWET